MTGNVIANEGFIDVYWTQYNAKGAKILAADILAAWGGIQSAGQGFAMISMNLCVLAASMMLLADLLIALPTDMVARKRCLACGCPLSS